MGLSFRGSGSWISCVLAEGRDALRHPEASPILAAAKAQTLHDQIAYTRPPYCLSSVLVIVRVNCQYCHCMLLQLHCECVPGFPKIRAPQYRPTKILIAGTPKKVPLIFGILLYVKCKSDS